MTLSTLVRGWRRVVEEPAAEFEIQIRRTLSDGHCVVQRRFTFPDLAEATAEFDKIRRLGGPAYTAEHGYRLVLLSQIPGGQR